MAIGTASFTKHLEIAYIKEGSAVMSENWRESFILSMEKTGRWQEKQGEHVILLGCLFEIQLKILTRLLEI